MSDGWETIYEGEYERLERHEVPDGWMYRSTQWRNAGEDEAGYSLGTFEFTESSVFVPSFKHR